MRISLELVAVVLILKRVTIASLLLVLTLGLLLPIPAIIAPQALQPPDTWWQYYHDWQNLTCELLQLNQSYSNILQVISIGKSVEGRDLWLCILTNFSYDPPHDKLGIWFDGATHGDEFIGTECCLHLIKYVCTHQDNATVQFLLNNYIIYVLPMVNPDGVEAGKTAADWDYEVVRKNAHGVDLNRNFDWYWRLGDSDPTSATYRGPSPFSEPETQAIRDFVSNHTVVLVLTLHSGTEALIYPWGHRSDSSRFTPENSLYEQIGAYIQQKWGYEYGTAYDTVGYTASGTTQDWFYGNCSNGFSPLSFTLEVYRGSYANWWEYFNPDPTSYEFNYTLNRVGNLSLWLFSNAGVWTNLTTSVQYPSSVALGDQFIVNATLFNYGVRNCSNTIAYVVCTWAEVISGNNTALETIYGQRTGLSPWNASVTFTLRATRVGSLFLDIVFTSSLEPQGDAKRVLGDYRVRVGPITVQGTDTQPPYVTILSPSNNSYVPASVTVTWEGSDNIAIDHYELLLDGQTVASLKPEATSYTLSDLSDGSHTITVIAYDTLGNTNQSTVLVTVDATPPSVQILEPSDNEWVGASVTVRWRANDNVNLSAIEIYLNDTLKDTLPPDASSYVITDLTTGKYVVLLRVNDTVGNSAEDSVLFNVDVSLPSIRITTPSENDLTPSHVEVRWEASDDSGIAYYQIIVDGTPYTTTTTASITLDLGDGNHSVTVEAYDLSGKSSSDTVRFTVDATPPSVEITSPQPGDFYNTSHLRIEWKAFDNHGIARIYLLLNGGQIAELPSGAESYELTNLSEGVATITVVVEDLVGCTSQASVEVTIDLTPPALVSSPPARFLNYTNITLQWIGEDNYGIQSYLVIIDDEQRITCSYCSVSVALEEGNHTIRIVAVDYAGNSASTFYWLVVDLTPPTVSILEPSPESTVNTTFSVVWTGSDNFGILYYLVRIDNAPWQSVGLNTSLTLSDIPEGLHTIYVRAIDAAGNSVIASVRVYVTHPAPPPSPPPRASWRLPLIVGVLAVVAVASLLVLLRCRRRRQA